MSTESVTIIRPDDFHVHVRDGGMMETVAPLTARHFGRSLVMPNVPAIHTGDEAVAHKRMIEGAASAWWAPETLDRRCEWLMSIKLTHRTTPRTIVRAEECGVVAAKLYPTGATHASQDGIGDPERLAGVFAEMQACGLVLCIHGEAPAAFVLDREAVYLDRVSWIVRNYPGLRVVLEHITTRASVAFVRDASVNVAATITAHHLTTTLDHLIGDGIRPHLYCKPVPKTPGDRDAIVMAALTYDRIFFGSDSAPHRRADKESACGCAGVFSAPVAMAVLAEVFLADGATLEAVARLQAFTGERGADFYGLPRNPGTIRLARRPWTVPDSYGEVVPFRAGETLDWCVDEEDDRHAAPE